MYLRQQRSHRSGTDTIRLLSLYCAAVLLVLVANLAGCKTKSHRRDDDDQNIQNDQANSTTNWEVNIHSHRPHSGRNSSQRIAGGYEAELGDYPSFVRTFINFGEKSKRCGGTIIGERLILTAAHCLVPADGRKLRRVDLALGSIEEAAPKKLQAEQYCVPQEFKRDRSNFDYALLIMEAPIEFSRNVQPASLPKFEIDDSYQAYTVGFGRTSNSDKRPPERLQVLPVKRVRTCPYQRKAANFICFKSNDPNHEGDPCRGDSGGPVYANVEGRQTVVGHVKGGVADCQKLSYPTIFISTFRLLPILDELAYHCTRIDNPDNKSE